MSRFWGLRVGLVVLLAGCTSTTPAAPGSASATVPLLAGTSWVVTRIGDVDTPPGRRPTMQFAATEVSGSASCNRYVAGYLLNGAGLTIARAAMTEMACTGTGVMEQEAAFAAALPAVTRVRTSAAGLELADARGVAVLTLARAPEVVDTPLQPTTWRLSGIVAGEAVSSPVAGSEVTLTITATALAGKACNTFRGSVTAADGKIAVGPLASTKLACTDAGLNAQEATVLKTLAAATGYVIEGDTLTITAAGGAGLTFTAL